MHQIRILYKATCIFLYSLIKIIIIHIFNYTAQAELTKHVERLLMVLLLQKAAKSVAEIHATLGDLSGRCSGRVCLLRYVREAQLGAFPLFHSGQPLQPFLHVLTGRVIAGQILLGAVLGVGQLQLGHHVAKGAHASVQGL